MKFWPAGVVIQTAPLEVKVSPLPAIVISAFQLNDLHVFAVRQQGLLALLCKNSAEATDPV